MLVCELEPGGPTAAGGPADVVLTVEEPTGPSSFRVHGSATLGGFVFVVWPCAGGLGFGGGFSSPTHATDTISAQEPHISALHPPFGPRGGGTHLSLRGTHLSAGSSWRVMVNGSECPLVGQPRYAPALPPLGTAGSLARGWAQGPPPTVPSSHGCRVPRQGEEAIRCTTPATGGLGSAQVALWIDGEEFLAPLPFQYRPDPFVSAIDPSCSYE